MGALLFFFMAYELLMVVMALALPWVIASVVTSGLVSLRWPFRAAALGVNLATLWALGLFEALPDIVSNLGRGYL